MIKCNTFLTIHSRSDHTDKSVSPLGELSIRSRTLNRDIQDLKYKKVSTTDTDTFDDFMLSVISFSKAEELKLLGFDTPLAHADMQRTCFLVAKEIEEFAANNSSSYTVDMLNTYMNGLTSLSIVQGTFKARTMMTPTSGSTQKPLPGFISFHVKLSESKIGDMLEMRIWLADKLISMEYKGYELQVVPPLKGLLDIFYNGTPTQVKEAIAARNDKIYAEQLMAVKNGIPETDIHVVEVLYKPEKYSSQGVQFTTYWSVVINGNLPVGTDAGESILDKEIIGTIIDNSTIKDPDDWRTIFPDLFSYYEFKIYPQWEEVAIPDSTIERSINSTVANAYKALEYASKERTTMSVLDAVKYVEIMPHTFKYLHLFVVSSLVNDTYGTGTDKGLSIRKLFPDYLPVKTNDAEFGRMTEKTKLFSLFISDLLRNASYYSGMDLDPGLFVNVTTDSNGNEEHFICGVFGDSPRITYMVKRSY